ncbi:MAG: DUF222 domain-containing protein [Candidatus Dormibacteria bacterium]
MDLAPAPADLAELDRLVAGYCERQPTSSSEGDLTASLCLKRALINRLELDFARDAAAFSATYEEEVHLNPSAVSWMKEHCRMTSTAAASAICVGEQAPRLEQSLAALAEGRVGFAHLALMASTAAAIDSSPSATQRFNETRLLARAESLSVVRFRTVCAHLRHEADRDAFLAAQLEQRDWRSLELKPCAEGGLSLTGFLDCEGGALLRSALEPLALRSGPDDDRPRAQRCADALIELCSRSLDIGVIPDRASMRSHVQVTTTLETLLDLVGCPAGELEDSGVIAGATVRRLACDATITRVLLDSRSAVIDVGRSERVVPGATRRALNIRDRGCRWPGCDRSASWTAAHHVVHWAQGGRTDLDNLVLLCHRHHWCVHEGGRQLVRTGEGGLLTLPPLPQQVSLARAPNQLVAV